MATPLLTPAGIACLIAFGVSSASGQTRFTPSRQPQGAASHPQATGAAPSPQRQSVEFDIVRAKRRVASQVVLRSEAPESSELFDKSAVERFFDRADKVPNVSQANATTPDTSMAGLTAKLQAMPWWLTVR